MSLLSNFVAKEEKYVEADVLLLAASQASNYQGQLISALAGATPNTVAEFIALIEKADVNLPYGIGALINGQLSVYTPLIEAELSSVVQNANVSGYVANLIVAMKNVATKLQAEAAAL